MEKTKIIAAGGLVSNTQNELLMIYRRGKWDLPKGKLDKGESIETCALREVAEETGVHDIELGDPIDITFHTYYDKYLQEEVIKETHWYAMRASGNPALVPQTEEDITAIEWVPKGQALEARLADSYDTIVVIVKKAGW